MCQSGGLLGEKQLQERQVRVRPRDMTDHDQARRSREESVHSLSTPHSHASKGSNIIWERRRDIPITILAWTILVVLLIWGASHIVRTLLILTIAGLLAYALLPLVKLFERVMPRFLAVLLVYIVVFGGVCLLLYFVIVAAIDQVRSLTIYLQQLLTPGSSGQATQLERILRSFGISSSQIIAVRDQVLSHAEGFATNIVPVITNFVITLLDIVVIAVMSIYLVLDGPRAASWLRSNAPQTAHVDFVLDVLQRIVGGYIRGQLLLSLLIGVLVGGGMAVFRVPYALLLGIMAFILEFIPILGTLISGVICTLLALTMGWGMALLVLGYFTIVHVLEGDIIGPRVVGKAVGLRPVVSLAALVAGSELFGIWGALFASPFAGVLQAVLIAFWVQWRETHPHHFENSKADHSSL
jgi:predicted PurR-regulated permease PerM